MKNKISKVLITAIGVSTIVILINFLKYHGIISFETYIMRIIRWVAIASWLIYAIQKKTLTSWIMVSLIMGIEFGNDFPEWGIKLNILSEIFLRLIKTVIAPLLFGTLVFGIAGHSNLKQVGRMFLKSIIYFEIVSTLALIVGLIAINITQAGVGMPMVNGGNASDLPSIATHSFHDVILNIFPENIAKSIAQGDVLQVVIFSILFGIAVSALADKFKSPMVRFCESLSETMFKFTKFIMYFAPLAIFGAISYSVGRMGLSIMVNLFELLGTLYLALFAFLLFVLTPIALLFKIPVKQFFKAVSEPATIAFATTSSESALPVAMKEMERFGVPQKVVSFVIPTGYSFNLDGTTLYLSLATIFIAQAAGIYLSIEKQIIIMLTLMLTSKGVAGVPRASLVILLATVSSFGLPVEPIFILLGIDILMDMGRTSINVIGNCLASAVVARMEKEFDDTKARNYSLEKI